MTIAEARDKCKSLLATIPKDALLVAILVLASSASFGLGFLAGRDTVGQGSMLKVEPPAAEAAVGAAGDVATSSPKAPASAVNGHIVASKNGGKYYLTSCSAANRISEANRVWFASAKAARTAGYAPAANCPGL